MKKHHNHPNSGEDGFSVMSLITCIIYVGGCAVFAAIGYQMLTLLEMPHRQSLWISIPGGIVAFLIFILYNAGGHFENWSHNRKRRARKEVEDWLRDRGAGDD